MDGPSYVMDSLDSQSGEPLAQALRQRLQEVEALQDNNPAYVIDSLDSQSGEPLALALQAHAAANEAAIGKRRLFTSCHTVLPPPARAASSSCRSPEAPTPNPLTPRPRLHPTLRSPPPPCHLHNLPSSRHGARQLQHR